MALKHANVRDKNKTLAVPGVYQFTIDNVSRVWETGNSQVAPHDKFTVSVKVACEDGERDVDDTFEDVDSYAWKFGKLFVAIGAVVPAADGGVDYDPEWMMQIKDRTGFVRLSNNSYQTKQGETRWSNRISYLDPSKVDPNAIGPTPGAGLPAEYVAQQVAQQSQAARTEPPATTPTVIPVPAGMPQQMAPAPAPVAAQPAQSLPTMANPAPAPYTPAQVAQAMANAGIAQPQQGTDEIPF